MKRIHIFAILAAALAPAAQADAILDWNAVSARAIAEAKLGTPPAVRAMAIVQTAAYGATAAATASHPDAPARPETAPGANVDAAVAAAHRASLVTLLPAARGLVEAAYAEAIAKIAPGAARDAGVATGEKAAALALASRAADANLPPESYRPHATPGAYVPTAGVAVPHWPMRKPWLLADAAQVRPAPPPALGSEAWSRDFDEVKRLGARTSAERTEAQTTAARFWEYSLPAIYFGVVRAAASQTGRGTLDNARLFASTAQAMDDAMIAVFDAKYRYGFWRPVTAIRNADQDGNDRTERAASWQSLIDSPMHPEYPSGHAILAGAVAQILRAESRGGGLPALSTTSPTLGNATRHWADADRFEREVGEARIWSGIHYRFSVEAGAEMGRRIGEFAAARYPAVR